MVASLEYRQQTICYTAEYYWSSTVGLALPQEKASHRTGCFDTNATNPNDAAGCIKGVEGARPRRPRQGNLCCNTRRQPAG